MLLPELTKEIYGYLPSELSESSGKPIKCRCDYCLQTYDSNNKRRKVGNKFLDKDCCIKCKYHKRDELGILRHGVPNPGSRPEVKTKIKQTCQSKYGTDAYTQSEDFKQKAKKTNLDRYGKKHACQSEEIKRKTEETCLVKYGEKRAASSNEVKQKIAESNINKYGHRSYLGSKAGKEMKIAKSQEMYGVDNPFASEEIKAKIVETNLKNLGVEYPMQSDEVRQKSIETNLDKYGVDNPAKTEDVKQKMRITTLERYGVENGMQSDIVKKRSRDSAIANGTLELFEGKTRREWAESLNKNYVTFTYNLRNYGFEYAISYEPSISRLEQVMIEFFQTYNIDYKHHFKVENRIADFYLPKANLLIETDGLFWHSDGNKNMQDSKYHFNKKRLYQDKGYKSFFFREDEIRDNFDIIQSMIFNRLGRNSSIWARKCQVKEITSVTAKEFLNQNHLMGPGKGESIGLIYNDVLVQLIQIKNKNTFKTADTPLYEVSRLCTKIGFNVSGGLSKLLKHLNLDGVLMNFVDLRHGEGVHLPGMGFEKVTCYPSFKWTDCVNTCHRLRYPGNTGYDNDLFKIWDCGQAKYIWSSGV